MILCVYIFYVGQFVCLYWFSVFMILCSKIIEERIDLVDNKVKRISKIVDFIERSGCDGSEQKAKLDFLKRHSRDLRLGLRTCCEELKSVGDDWQQTTDQLEALSVWCNRFTATLSAVESNVTDEQLKKLEVCFSLFFTLQLHGQ